MPDDRSSTFAQRDAMLADIEARSEARSAFVATLPPNAGQLANNAALYYPQVSQSYPGAVASAAQSGDPANVAAVGEAGTKEKNDSGDWWNPGDLVSSAASAATSAIGEVAGAVGSAASTAGSAALNYGVKPATRALTAAASTGWEAAQNIMENRTPMSSDVIHMGLGNTRADEQARKAYGDQLKRIGADDGLSGVTKPITEAARATTGYQAVVSAVQDGGLPDMGHGFTPSGQVHAAQAQAARDVRGTIKVPVGEKIYDAQGNVINELQYNEGLAQVWSGGNAYGIVPEGGRKELVYKDVARTMGREAGVSLFESGSGPYNIFSGLVDAVAIIGGDPVNRLHPLRGVFERGQEANRIVNADVVGAAKKTAEEAVSWVRDHPQGSPAVTADAEDALARFHAAADAKDVTAAKRAAGDLETAVTRLSPGETNDANRFAAGLIDGVRNTVHQPTAEQWIQAHPDVLQRFADDKSFSSVFYRLGGRVDPRIAAEITAADTPEAVADIFRRGLGGEIPVGPATVYRGPKGEAVRVFYDWVHDHRTFRDMPGEEWLSDTKGQSSHDLAESVRSMDDSLVNARIPAVDRDEILGDYAAGLSGTQQDIFAAQKAALRAIEVQLKGVGLPEQAARGLTHRIGEDIDTIRSYSKDAMGNDSDHGLAKSLADQSFPGWEDFTGSEVVSPISLEQSARRAVTAPDARVIRRLTAHPIMRALTTKTPSGAAALDAAEYGAPRLPIAAADWITTNLFKRPAVLRLAFIPRVMGEEMVYLALAGGPSPFTHPSHFLALAGSKALGEDITGEAFARAPKGTLPQELDKFQEGLNVSADVGADSYAGRRLLRARGDYALARKGVDENRWVQGMSDQLAAASTNPLKRMVAKGNTTDDIMGYLRSADGSKDFDELQGMLNRKGLEYRAEGRTVRMKVDLSSDAALRTYIDTYVRGDVQRLVGDNPALRDALATGHVGTESLSAVPNTEIAAVLKRPEDNAWVGTQVRLQDGRLGTVSGESLAGHSDIQVGAPAWQNREAAPALQKELRDWHAAAESPDKVDVWTRPVERRAMTDGDVIARSLSFVSRHFFGTLYGKPSDYLVRSPFFRQKYYDELEHLMPNLAPDAANQALKQLGRHMGETPVADEQLARMIEAAKTAGGNLDLEAADALAKGRALDTMHHTFYDWSRKSQFFDITRNIFPFGSAWTEMLGRYARLLKHDPVTTVRRAQLAVNGINGLKDTTGWFSADPQTGQTMINFALSGALTQLATGVNAPMQGRLAGLTLGTEVIPGLGPVASMALNKILPDMPETSDIEQILFPYGRPKTGSIGEATESLLPSWLKNVGSALLDRRNTTGIFGNTYIDVLRVKAASGDYDLSDQKQVSKMMDDASHDARTLSVMRAIGQFASPTAPSYDFVVKSGHGDVLASMLVDDLDHMRQNDQKNGTHDATKNFLDKYGEQARIYLQGKTRATLGGLEPNTEFGDWEQQHSAQVKEFPEVAGYFAPEGKTFDFEVFRRQVANGDRRYLTDREIIDASNATMGRFIYNQARTAVGAKPSDQQRLVLAQLRSSLAVKYPGFDPSGDSTPDKTALRVIKLRDAVKDPELVKTDAGQAISTYLAARDMVQKQANKAGDVSFLQSKRYAPQRAILRQLGNLLTDRHPEFARVWDEVFDREMAQDLEQKP